MDNNNYPRSAFSAALFSSFLPGLGQLYNGDLNKALYFLMGYLLISPLLFLAATLLFDGISIMDGLMTWLLVTVLIWLMAIIDGWRSARRKKVWQLLSWQRSGVYIFVFIMAHFMISPSITSMIRHHLIESFKVPSGSMEPNIYAGDMLFADKRYNCPGCIMNVQRGDVVIFVYPNDRTQYFIKRVIGLPGDEIKVQQEKILVNGKVLEQQRTLTPTGLRITEQSETHHWQVEWRDMPNKTPQVSFKVPNGQIFVMGDNRSNSNDSRYYGTIPLIDVVGKATLIWFSLDFKTYALHWNRMGLVIP